LANPFFLCFSPQCSLQIAVEYKIGEIFGEIKSKFRSGYSLRDALELMDSLRFRSQKEKHELSHLYEAKIKNMGNAGRNGGEYYTRKGDVGVKTTCFSASICYLGGKGSADYS
jgi:type I restriction enzyme M protein